jgi:hypothetical protein
MATASTVRRFRRPFSSGASSLTLQDRLEVEARSETDSVTTAPVSTIYPSASLPTERPFELAANGNGQGMRVFVTGATGTVGTRLVPQLVERGHDVTGPARSPERAARLATLGGEPVVLNELDSTAVGEAVRAARPDAIVHEATALGGASDVRHFDRTFHQANLLRTRGTDALLAAAAETGVDRFVAQSSTSWPYARVGGPAKTETDPLDPEPVPDMRERSALSSTSRAPRSPRVGSRFATDPSTAPRTMHSSNSSASASLRSSATAAASGRSSTRTMPQA